MSKSFADPSHEKAAIMALLEIHNFNITKAAKALGIDRKTIYNKCAKYGIVMSK